MVAVNKINNFTRITVTCMVCFPVRIAADSASGWSGSVAFVAIFTSIDVEFGTNVVDVGKKGYADDSW